MVVIYNGYMAIYHFTEVWSMHHHVKSISTSPSVNDGDYGRLCLWQPMTHWGQDKMDAISQTTVSRAFSSMKNCCILIKFSLKYIRKGAIDNNRALVQIMAWRRSGDKPLSEPMMVRLPTDICVARPQWVKHIDGYTQHSNVNIWLLFYRTKTLVQLNDYIRMLQIGEVSQVVPQCRFVCEKSPRWCWANGKR